VQNLDCLAYDYAQNAATCELHWDKATSAGQYVMAAGYNAYDFVNFSLKKRTRQN
jgi:hypothetical protein